MRHFKSKVNFSGLRITPVSGLGALCLFPLSIPQPQLVPGTLPPGHAFSIGS